MIIDLTPEIPELGEVIANKTYIYLPTLDASIPGKRIFQNIVKKVVNWEGNVYIYCASGYGRFVTLAAAFLIAKGLANNVEQAAAIIKKVRYIIKLSRVQINFLNRVMPSIKSDLKYVNFFQK